MDPEHERLKARVARLEEAVATLMAAHNRKARMEGR